MKNQTKNNNGHQGCPDKQLNISNAVPNNKNQPQPLSISKLLKYDVKCDPNAILSWERRWLCKGGSCLVIGSSGIGKSCLSMQAAILWAMGKPLFSIEPRKPLKSLIIQAENDHGDLAEMVQGVVRGMELDKEQATVEHLDENVIIVRVVASTGEAFIQTVLELCLEHKPDLVWIDPVLAFIGGDISKQEVASKFLRGGLNDISEQTGVCFMLVHHSGKPSKNAESKTVDLSYAGLGSSELTNWARAAVVLKQVNEDTFSLTFAKRGKRAGAIDMDGNPTRTLYLKYAASGICWEQTDAPVPVAKGGKGKFQPKFSDADFLKTIDSSKGYVENQKLCKEKLDMSTSTFRRRWKEWQASQVKSLELKPETLPMPISNGEAAA